MPRARFRYLSGLMIDRRTVEDGYVRRGHQDPGDIADLFTTDAVYDPQTPEGSGRSMRSCVR